MLILQMQQTIGNIRCFILTPKETISFKKSLVTTLIVYAQS